VVGSWRLGVDKTSVTLTARDTSGLRSFWRPRVGSATARAFSTRSILIFLIPVLAVAWVYGPTVAALVRQWATDDDYSHGFFVVPLAAFFAWERRDRLRTLPVRSSSVGALVLCGSLVCFVAGQFGSELFLSRVSLIGVLAGLVLWLGGWRYLGALAFPLGFLLLMVPLPEIIFSRITFPLQMLASRLGEAVIAASGIPVLREGNILQLPGRALEVVEACSGIRSLMTLVMLGIVLGYFTERRTSTRVALAVAAIPIAVCANAIRVAGTGLISYWVSPAAADGFFHSFSGWIVFVVALVGLLAFQRVLDLARTRWSAPAEASC
jgi:exosortase